MNKKIGKRALTDDETDDLWSLLGHIVEHQRFAREHISVNRPLVNVKLLREQVAEIHSYACSALEVLDGKDAGTYATRVPDHPEVKP